MKASRRSASLNSIIPPDILVSEDIPNTKGCFLDRALSRIITAHYTSTADEISTLSMMAYCSTNSNHKHLGPI
eukprot:931986-Pyramimonas_sp.AAC.2